MLKLIEKLKKYIAEHYTGEEPFVESYRAFYERLLEAQKEETRHKSSSTMECLCLKRASKCNEAFGFNDGSSYVEEVNSHSNDCIEEIESLENDSLNQKKSVISVANESCTRMMEVPRPQEAAQSVIEEAEHSASGMMLCKQFKRIDSLDELLHKKSVTFADKLNQLLCEKNLDAVYVYKRANIDRRLFSKLLRKDYKPGKNTILALVMSMQLTMAEARELLSYAGYGLAPNNRTDIIISFFLENEIYDMDRLNETLYLYGEKCLGNLSA